MAEGKPTIGHVLNTYLGRSATFIYTMLRAQSRVRPVVLARRTENVEEFPLRDVVCLLPDSRGYRRVARGMPVLARRDYARRLVRAARGRDCVALHAHFGWAACDSLEARRRLRVPLVATFYGKDLAPSYPDRYPYGQLFREAAFVLCEGPVMAGRLAELGCPLDKVRIERIGLDLARFPFAPPRRSKPLVVLQAARLVEKKGVDLSIRAFAAARRRLPQSQLWIAGDGPERAALEALSRRLGVASSVRFLGMLTHPDYRELLRSVQICVQPSRTASDGDTEGGAPTVLLEMQARGIPVLTTRHADIPFVVPDSNPLVDEEDVEGLTDGLVRVGLSSDAQLRAETITARRLIEREHDSRLLAARIERIYEDAVEAGARSESDPSTELR